MATKATLSIQAQAAQEKALQVVADLNGSAERLESIEKIPLNRAHTRFPDFLAALHAELIAGLAEIATAHDQRISEQDQRISEQDQRISELEAEAVDAAAKSTEPKTSALAKKKAGGEA